MLSVRQKLKLCGFALGIFVSYSIFGVLQERIFRGRYVSENSEVAERFTFSVGFVAVQCIVYTLFAKGILVSRDQISDDTNPNLYILIATFFVAATVTSNMALKWISYPTQVVGKAAKPILVMVLGVLIGRKSYAPRKYIYVLMIVIGVCLFVFKDRYDPSDGEDPLIGGCFVGFSLFMDGLTGAFQDRARSFSKPSSMSFMYNVNLWGTVILVSIMAITGEGREMIEFARRHPSVIWHLLSAVLVGTFGQTFISLMISNFGSLPLSLVTTTRKFFTVFVSVVVFENKLTVRQWIASAMIFLALFLDAFFSKKGINNSESATEDSEIAEEVKSDKEIKDKPTQNEKNIAIVTNIAVIAKTPIV